MFPSYIPWKHQKNIGLKWVVTPNITRFHHLLYFLEKKKKKYNKIVKQVKY